jgi:outer membrane receptor protein involved in Fe transport
MKRLVPALLVCPLLATLAQMNAFAGYRSPRRRAELRLGLLNLTDRDYRLSPPNVMNQDRFFRARPWP